MNRYFYFKCCFVMLIAGCTTNENNERIEEEPVEVSLVVPAQKITVAIAEKKPFVSKIVSNGRVEYGQEIPLFFQKQGIVQRVLVKNGERVKAGQLVATLVNEEQKLALKENELVLQESKVEINDQLLTQGGKRGDSTSVSADVYSFIKLRSGYERALLGVEKAKLDLSKTYVYAPVNGTIANLTLSDHTPVGPDKPLCLLLNTNEVLIKCTLLESGFSKVAVGQQAKVSPIGVDDLELTARISSINPLVDNDGLIEITLKLIQPDARIISGMNMRVVVERNSSNRVIIPKESVVEHQNKKIVFTHENGRAKWNFVRLGQENDKEIEVLEGINAGDEVIVSGHLNLNHNAEVTLL